MKILHVEDSVQDSELTRNLLEKEGLQCEIVRVEKRQDFFEAIQSSQFDLIISDCSLPGFNGLEALELAQVFNPNIPFLFFSGTIGEEAAIESLRNGASDYVLKDHAAKLPSAVRRVINEADERKLVAKLKRELSESRIKESEEYLARGLARQFNHLFSLIHDSVTQLEKGQGIESAMKVLHSIRSFAEQGRSTSGLLLRQAGGNRVRFSPIDLNEEVKHLLTKHRLLIPETVDMVLEWGEDLPLIEVDVLRLESLFFLILQNAIEAVKSGGRIWVSTQYVEGAKVPGNPAMLMDAPYLCLGVIDTGAGMAEEPIQKSYQPILGIKNSQIGSGLCGVEGLMKGPKAMLDIMSEVEVGTAVSLYLPT